MADLPSLFAQRDIPFESLENGGVRSAFVTPVQDGGEYTFGLLVLRVQDDFGDWFVRFTIVPYLERPQGGYPHALVNRIGQINHYLPLMKFALDADGDLELALDVEADSLQEPLFGHVLQMLADYAGSYFSELQALVAEGNSTSAGPTFPATGRVEPAE